MIKPAKYYAETTFFMLDKGAFSDVLSSLNVSGTLLLAEEYQPPWAIEIPDARALALAIPVAADTKIVPFHLVRRGSFELHTDDASPLVVRAGEVVICTGGQRHTMVDGEPDRVIPFEDLLDDFPVRIRKGRSSGATELVCGVFMLGNTNNNPLIEALPPIVHADVSGRNGGKTIQLLAELLLNEIEAARSGQGYMSDRILEMFCAEAIRIHMEAEGTDRPGWFRGLSDPKVGAVLNKIHEAPGAAISVSMLAQSVGMSVSRFAARFRTALGEAPMSYVSRWRMNVASRLIADTDLGVEEIAHRVGYESLPAFTRAFRKYFALPPAQWRRKHRAGLPVRHLE
ncbi:MAG: AraC family transcriptional regulator [Alphaproteobacteria bacterium]|nr:AraC family transcriptional regulator [Alphaproteobacteria bacterium]